MPIPSTNNFGVQVPPLDYSYPGTPITKSSHGLSIANDNDEIVGRITSWQAVPYNRDVTAVMELTHNTAGAVVDAVPGKVGDQTIAFGCAEIWGRELEIALGYPQTWVTLLDQDHPMNIFEYLHRGSTVYSLWKYSGVWFREKTYEATTADGDFIIKVSGTLFWVKRTRII